MSKIFITAALTGAVHVPSMSPYLPITPDQIAEDAAIARESGAAVVHIHARNPVTGEPSSSVELMREIIEKVKKRCDAIICITTGASQLMTVDERLFPIAEFEPELASCNAGSMNFVLAEIAEKIDDGFGWEKTYLNKTRDNVFKNTFYGIEKYIKTMEGVGTKPEFEVYDVAMINNLAYFKKKGVLRGRIYIQFVLGILGGLPATVENLVFLKNTADKLLGDYIWSVAAAGRHQLTMAAVALAMGGNVRVGLEDSLYIKRGVLSKSSGEQVLAVKTISEVLGYDLASPSETREIIGLKGVEKVMF
jgi:uncharacterized protein (DUF849 family)